MLIARRLLRGGANGSIFGKRAEAYSAAGNIVAGAGVEGNTSIGNGGSYAGYGDLGQAGAPAGGQTNEPYGLLETPSFLGSGGGAARDEAPGGNGGGRIKIQASIIINNGIIRANGGAGVAFSFLRSGGGSGGSILIDCGTFTGSGSIEANGGNGFQTGCCSASGGGGGGRIAIYYDSFNFNSNNISCAGGSSPAFDQNFNAHGGAGTIYLKDNGLTSGLLILDNNFRNTTLNTLLHTQVTFFDSIRILETARLNLTTVTVNSINLEHGISIESNSTILVSPNFTLFSSNSSGPDIQAVGNSYLQFAPSSIISIDYLALNNSIFDCFINQSYSSSTFLMNNNSKLNIWNNSVFAYSDRFDPPIPIWSDPTIPEV